MMTVTQIYGFDRHDHVKLEVTLNRDDVELIELGKESAENFLVEHDYGNYEECIVDAIFPLLDAIIKESK